MQEAGRQASQAQASQIFFCDAMRPHVRAPPSQILHRQLSIFMQAHHNTLALQLPTLPIASLRAGSRSRSLPSLSVCAGFLSLVLTKSTTVVPFRLCRVHLPRQSLLFLFREASLQVSQVSQVSQAGLSYPHPNSFLLQALPQTHPKRPATSASPFTHLCHCLSQYLFLP